MGVSFMSGRDQDSLLLSVGLAFEQAGSGSPRPSYNPTVSVEDMQALSGGHKRLHREITPRPLPGGLGIELDPVTCVRSIARLVVV